MIKISKNNLTNRIAGFVITSFPMDIVLLVGWSGKENLLQLVICALISCFLLALNIYLNFFDHEIFFDEEKDAIIIKRYKKEYPFSNYRDFNIDCYLFQLSTGLQFYRFEIANKKYRFKYLYSHTKYVLDMSSISKGIHDEIVQKIESSKIRKA
ncbi:MAG: hypothetical protein P4L41_15330 [Flavipsychrobacter sp.]|nr:hypothetical protein [Flavipsychrobacter sp.]